MLRPSVRCATLDGYVGLARSLGLDPAGLLASVGLDVADLAVPDKWVPAVDAMCPPAEKPAVPIRSGLILYFFALARTQRTASLQSSIWAGNFAAGARR